MIDRWVFRDVRITSPGWQTAVTMIWLPSGGPVGEEPGAVGAVGLGGEGLGLGEGRAGHAVEVAEARADVEAEHVLADRGPQPGWAPLPWMWPGVWKAARSLGRRRTAPRSRGRGTGP